MEAQESPPNTSAPKAKLTALTRAIKLGKGQRVNIYTDAKYAFLMHMQQFGERGLLTTKNSPIKQAEEFSSPLNSFGASGSGRCLLQGKPKGEQSHHQRTCTGRAGKTEALETAVISQHN